MSPISKTYVVIEQKRGYAPVQNLPACVCAHLHSEADDLPAADRFSSFKPDPLIILAL